MFSRSSDTKTALDFSRYLDTQGQIPSILFLVAMKRGGWRGDQGAGIKE